MREHMGLYRGKRIDNGQWIEGCYFIQLFRDKPEERVVHKIKPIGGMGQEVDPDTIGECIGAPDKNGKLIFEGDVYRYYDNEIHVVEFDEDCHVIGLHTFGEEEVKKGRRTVKRKFEGWNALVDYPLGEMEYLGNIHDNPEILKAVRAGA